MGSDQPQVHGTVTLWTTRSIHRQGVSVILRDRTGNAVEELYTDKIGDYVLPIPTPGLYSLTVSYKSFCPAGQPVFQVADGQVLRFDFDLLLCVHPESFDRRAGTSLVPVRDETIKASNGINVMVSYGRKLIGAGEVQFEGPHPLEAPDLILPVVIRFDRFTLRADRATYDIGKKLLKAKGKVAVSNGITPSENTDCAVIRLYDTPLIPQHCGM